jgi:O-antigen/teichoic acid export membrane protein
MTEVRPPLSPVPTFWSRIFNGRLLGELTWIVVGQALTATAGLVGVRLLTGALVPELYGELALGLTAVTLAQQVVIAPFAAAALRFFSTASTAGTLPGFVHALIIDGRRAATLLVLPTMVVCIGSVLANQLGAMALAAACCLYAVCLLGTTVLDSLQNAARDRASAALHQGGGQWARFLTAFALVRVLGPSSAAAMTGFGLASFGVLMLQRRAFQRRWLENGEGVPPREDVEAWRQAVHAYGWPFSAWGIFTWAQVASDRWALHAAGLAREVGLYAVIYQLGYYPLALAATAAVQFFAPVAFRWVTGDHHAGHGRVRRLGLRLCVLTLAVTVLAVAVAWAVSSSIFEWFTAVEYRSAAPLLPIMVGVAGMFAAAQFASLPLLGAQQSARLLTPKIATAVLGVVLNVAGAMWCGLDGVVWAVAVVAAIYLGWIIVLVARA